METLNNTSTIEKFDTIIESFVNGNISWVREQVKKLRLDYRKALYLHAKDQGLSENTCEFFFSLI